MISFKKQEKKHKFVERGLYFITSGDQQGSFILNIKERGTKHEKAFLLIPNLAKALLPSDKIKELFENGLFEYVQTIPMKVYKVCLAQFDALK